MTTSTTPTVPAAPPAPVSHLFRHSLLAGRVHPLQHLVQRYRQESPR